MCAIKAFAWHPLKPVVAVLHRQDAVYVYDLRKGFVGKNQGILLNANMDGANSSLLFVGCTTTPSVFVVDNSIGEVVAVCRKIVGKGTKSLSVSKDGKYLVQICRSKFLRLWNTATMESVDLETTGPNFRDACFMPDSKTLLIAVDSDGTVTGSTGCVSALQLAGNGGLAGELNFISRIGGTIKSIALDSKGERLAVTFGNPFIHVQEFACGRDLVFLFDVKLAPHLVLSEIGQLTGPEWDTSIDSTQAPPRLPRGSAVTEPAIVAGPRPMAFAFASNVGGIVKDRQPLLAIAWENGDLEFKVLQ
ncbi:hypothetical protein HDU84_004941 [Entophlyctis sp. JEL0112]|nr:hypothetical protein HDU84_004941 [Entophlyctis sp. JEL0112]